MFFYPSATHTHSRLSSQSFHIGKLTFNFCLSESDLVQWDSALRFQSSLCKTLGLVVLYGRTISQVSSSHSLSILLLSGACHMTAVTSEKINRSVQVSLLCTCFLLPVHKPTQAWESGLGRRSIFNLLKTDHSVSCVATLTHLHLCLQCTKVLSLRILFNICCIVLFR